MKLLSHEKLEDISGSDYGNVAKYKLEIEIPAAFSKQKRKESIQEMKKYVEVPGFRKGTIPSFMMGELIQFVFRDCVDDMVSEAVEELNLNRLDDESSPIDYDFENLSKSFTPGQDFTLSCQVQLTDVVDAPEGDDDDDDSLEDMITVDPADQGPEIEVDEAKAEFLEALREENKGRR